jgi:CHAT domain
MDDVYLQILPGPSGPQVAISSPGARVGGVRVMPLPLPPTPPADGPALWHTLPELVRRSLAELHGLAAEPPVPLWLDVQAPELADWPWELLAPADIPNALPFSLLPHAPLVRYAAAGRAPTVRPGALRVLALIASPPDLRPLDAGPLLELLDRLRDPARIDVAVQPNCTPDALREALARQRPDLLLALAHGEPGAILLEDRNGDTVPLTAGELASLIAGTAVRAVVLASCDGATPAGAERSTAEALLAAGALGVVAMRGPISTDAAVAFLDGLLDGIAAGQALEVAVVAGRQAVVARHSLAGEWAVPVCWQRVLHRPLVQPAPEVLRRGASTLAQRASTWARPLAAGGMLGLLAVASIQPLLAGGAATIALPAVVELLKDLGLNVFAGYLGSALGQVWQQTGGGAAAATPDEIAKALQLIVDQHNDAAAQMADLAYASEALKPIIVAIQQETDGSRALLAGLDYDLRRHGAALDALGAYLRVELAGLHADLRQGFGAIFRQGERIEGKVDELRTDVGGVRDDTRATRGDVAEIKARMDAGERERQAEEQRSLREYLGALSEQCNVLSLADADSSDPNKRAVSLDSVYVRLEIERTRQPQEQSAGRERERHLTVLEALAQQPRLVLLGAPGSGKSTAVHFVARCLALAQIDDQQRWLGRLGAEWPHGSLIPVYVILREFAAWIIERRPAIERGDAGLLWAFLATRHGAALAACLRRLAHEGRVLLLLDGLDEVGADTSGRPLAQVHETIAVLAGGLGAGSRALVTCRVLDYPLRRLGGWQEDSIQPLSPELQAEFIQLWYAELDRLKRPLDDSAARLQERLTRAVREGADLARLARNPLLLTMMALVHSYKGRLPETRVRLYEECIEFLLERWRRRVDERPLRTRLELDQGQWSEQNLLEVLYLLGYAAHRRGVHTDDESGADLPYHLVTGIVQPYFRQRFGERKSAARAEALAEFAGQASNGVLQIYQHRPGDAAIYRFPHRTFQEYLAGHALINGDLLLENEQPDDDRDLISRALRVVDSGAQWREALLLAAGRRIVSGERRSVVDLARELLMPDPALAPADQGRRVMLASDLLLEIGAEPPAGIGQRLAPTWNEARGRLLALLPHPPSALPSPLTPAERARAGLLLARLSDQRPGVCTLPRGLDDLYWCGPFPAGEYPIADGNAHVRLREFRVARYPVTVWQFRQFVEAKGYEDERWWTKSLSE